MNLTLPDLTITITKTADGKSEYVQIMSADQFAMNIVLISNKITVKDTRRSGKEPECR